MKSVSIDKLLSRTNSKYMLVVAASKRARALMNGEESMIEPGQHKPVVIALGEIEEGKLICHNDRFKRRASGDGKE